MAAWFLAAHSISFAPQPSVVLKNVELKGSTMGSRKEFEEMVGFVREKGIRPVVSKVVRGLDNLGGIDELFEEMKEASMPSQNDKT
ncbi:hypothetical protein B0H65DRAFT_428327 [Neurospora tetraspora]|uniref:Uncharacterized protein n=1 Tax=Neurospora tetraspora TaxID=94610 RepID=A0AAE0JD85_9PEZI|nr:hypothetical protein B0H65DRAFT_428327 [Neurospora tetraspora]